MSFADKLASLMHRPNDDLVSKDEVPAWQKHLARGLGTIAGGLGIILSTLSLFLDVITFSGILGPLMGVFVSFSVLVFEAPFCCIFINYMQEISNWMENRPYWNKAAYYLIGAIIPILLKLQLIFGMALIFCTGLLYGIMALGTKASVDEMRSNATRNNQQVPPTNMC